MSSEKNETEMIRPFFRSVTNLLKLSAAKQKNFLNSFDTVLTDCDGVLWIIRDVIPGSPEALNGLRNIGKKIFFVTNNCMTERKKIVHHATDIGYVINHDEILTPGRLIRSYLENKNFSGKAYVIGMEGLVQELSYYDKIQQFGDGPDVVNTPLIETIMCFPLEEDVKAVIVGIDQHFSYNKMLKACTYLANPDCLFLASCKDKRYPTIMERVIPGTGSLVTAIESGADREATILGKPSSLIGELLVKNHGIDPSRTLVVGDTLQSDISLGSKCGFQTLLVLSGDSNLEQVRKFKESGVEEQQEMVPDFYLPTLGDLCQLLTMHEN